MSPYGILRRRVLRITVPAPVRIPWEFDADRDGASFVVVDHASTVRVWDTDTGNQRLAFRVGSEPKWLVNFVRYSPDGRLLAVGTVNGEVILKDATSGRTVSSFSCRSRDGQKTEVNLLAFSADGRYLAVCSQFYAKPGAKQPDSEPPPSGLPLAEPAQAHDPSPRLAEPPKVTSDLRIIDVTGCREVAHLPVRKYENIFWASFTPDSTALVAVEETFVKIWDAATGTERAIFERDESFPHGCAFSADGTLLATGENNIIRLVDLAKGNERAVLKTWGPVKQIAFEPDGKWLTATGYSLRTWDLRAALVPRFDEGHTHEVTAVAYAPGGTAIASGSEDRTVKIWDLARRKPRLTLRGHEAEVTSLVFTPDGKSVITASLDRTVRIWDANDGRERAKLIGHTLPVVSVAISPDGRMVASAGERDNRFVELFIPPEPNGQPAVSVAKPAPDFGEVKLWDIATGRLKATPLDSARPAKSGKKSSTAVFGRFEYIAEPPIVTFSPRGSTLAIGKEDGTIDLWDIAMGKARTLPSATNKDSFGYPDILCLSYSPDGLHLVAGSRDATIHVWDMSPNGERQIATLAHSDYVVAVAFSRDGRYVAGADRDGIINLWSAATWRGAGRVQSQDRGFTSLAFSPDSKSVAGGHSNHDILIYPVDRMLKPGG